MRTNMMGHITPPACGANIIMTTTDISAAVNNYHDKSHINISIVADLFSKVRIEQTR